MKPRQFLSTLGLTVAAIVCAESLVRVYSPDGGAFQGNRNFRIAESPTPAETLQTLASSTVSGREIDNRYTVVNIARLSRHPQPETVTTAFVGTSRTRLLRPELIGWQNAVISAGNSYNEISYSYLIEASFLKAQFPNLKYVFVETSLLNRQAPPPDFIVSSDHRKYLPLLVSAQKEIASKPSAKAISTFLSQQEKQSQPWQTLLDSELLQQQDRFKISTLLGLNETQKTIPVVETDLFKQLNERGEQVDAPLTAGPSNAEARSSSPEIQAEDPKITRLVDIKSRYPWDEQFLALADWAKVNGVTVIFFQPPVRSDFYTFQEQYGVDMHRQEVAELAQASGLPFIDLNVRSLDYGNDWSLFSDADHMGSCKGSYLYPMALKLGFERWQKGQLMPTVTRQEALQKTLKAAEQLKPACPLTD
jgi:hypothetical protein